MPDNEINPVRTSPPAAPIAESQILAPATLSPRSPLASQALTASFLEPRPRLDLSAERPLNNSILAQQASPIEIPAPLIQALIYLNAGELNEARSILETMPEDEISPILLEELRNFEGRRRQDQIAYLWQGGLVAYVERYRERGGADPEQVQEELASALAAAREETVSGRAVSIDAALLRDERPNVRAFINDSRQASYLGELSRSALNERSFARAILRAARRFLHSGDYVAAIHLANFLRDAPHLGREARELVDGIPTDAAIDGALASLRSMTIVFADNDRAALESGVFSIATLGIARAGGLLAESAFAASSAARGAAAISPLALNAGRWAVRSGSEAAIFSASSMATQALLSGNTDHLTLENFSRQFGAMLVTFGLLRLAGRGWSSRVASLTLASYLNEGLGLEESSGVSLGGRIFSSAAMDAQMMVAGGLVEGLSGGRLSRMERRSETNFRSLLEEARLRRMAPGYLAPSEQFRRFALQVALQTALLAIGMPGGGGRFTYRVSDTREARRLEIQERFRDPQGDIRDRVRAIADYAEHLSEESSDEGQRQEGILELLDLAIDPRSPQATSEYANSPEDEGRILRTFVLETVSQLLPENPDAIFRQACSLKIAEFIRAAHPHLQFELIPAPADWPAGDPRYLSPELGRSLENAPNGAFPEHGALDLNQPLRNLLFGIRDRLGPTPPPTRPDWRSRSQEGLGPRFQILELWHHHMTEQPALRVLYQVLSLGFTAVSLRAYLELDLPFLAEVVGSASLALLGAAMTDAPHLIRRFIVQPDLERRNRWTEYLAENAELIRLQLEMGRRHPFAALAPRNEIPLTRVELAPELAEVDEEAEWEAELEEAIRRAERENED